MSLGIVQLLEAFLSKINKMLGNKYISIAKKRCYLNRKVKRHLLSPEHWNDSKLHIIHTINAMNALLKKSTIEKRNLAHVQVKYDIKQYRQSDWIIEKLRSNNE